MVLFAWNHRFATGIDPVDGPHKALFMAINDLHEAFASNRAIAQTARTLDFLMEYTVNQFQREEHHMQQHRFDGLPGHRCDHVRLHHEVMKLDQRWREAPGSVRPMEMAGFLGDWLTHHLLGYDDPFAKFMKGKEGFVPAGVGNPLGLVAAPLRRSGRLPFLGAAEPVFCESFQG